MAGHKSETSALVIDITYQQQDHINEFYIFWHAGKKKSLSKKNDSLCFDLMKLWALSAHLKWKLSLRAGWLKAEGG